MGTVNSANAGDVIYVPVETDPDGGAYDYTVKITGDGLYDFIIVGRVKSYDD